LIVGITFDGKICYCKGEDLAKTRISGNTIAFNMRLADDSITTASQLKSLLKL
jgi:hypothetical protein